MRKYNHPRRKTRSTRAQSATEFIIITTAAFLIILSVFTVFERRTLTAQDTASAISLKGYTRALAARINAMAVAGDGTNTTFTLPETSRTGENYTLDIYPDYRLVETRWHSRAGHRSYSYPLAAANVTGRLTGLENTTIVITNSGGVIILA